MTKHALIVAHGQPSDPAPAERDLDNVARAVSRCLPDWHIRAATLATPGALETAVDGVVGARVMPFFMSDGWFTKIELPRRLAAAGAQGFMTLPAFGLMPEAAALAVQIVRDALSQRGWNAEDSTVVLAAHGSGRSRAPAEAAARIRDAIAHALPIGDLRLGFIEEAPLLEDAAKDANRRALCLPLFVARWGHVVSDVPAALDAAGFAADCLPPLGVHASVPGIIARAIAG
ncbi:cobalamin biosynthesis protein CbiX [Defluviimonas sp. WL0002]|uniref:Cobalamin biosynthesis protein CbiX n=1 Tax=Albidovulum marisflavi TaxID=2984159 RepID=A0ABT2ZEV6_9RHOB|nr:CbiX/SirB N-terminal domain-containing protein [Defluviimonas sp. WL0002]MCV2869664.1 cobalamin biosynthesis protein CbiX [Defluviimonas sp. WL0002]